MSKVNREFKDRIYGELARLGKAVAAPKRLELLELLSQCPRTVEALAAQASLSVANASQHLKVLRAARLVDAEKRGLYVEYRLTDAAVGEFYRSLRTLAESHLAEVEQVTRAYLSERGAMEAVRPEELLQRVRRGEVTLLDVRPAEEYRAGHIAGALSVPVPELKKRISGLPKSRDIVAYCRGPYCVMAIEAVELLRSKGYKAHRLEQGVSDLRAAGWQIESASR